MDEEIELRRGDLARQILENDVFTDSFSIIRDNIHKDFENSKSSDSEGREKCWFQLNALKAIEQHIHSVFDTGKMARAAREARKPKD